MKRTALYAAILTGMTGIAAVWTAPESNGQEATRSRVIQARAERDNNDEKADARVIIADGRVPIDVTLKDVIRVISNRPTGATVAITFSGPAKLERKAVLKHAAHSPKTLETEFEFKPTDTGTVVVKMVTTRKDHPTPEGVVYTFNVK
jgi:hypothetical protein